MVLRNGTGSNMYVSPIQVQCYAESDFTTSLGIDAKRKVYLSSSQQHHAVGLILFSTGFFFLHYIAVG